MTGHPADSVILKMVEQVKVFYLTPGTIVQVTEEDSHTGTSKIRLAGITVDLWTLTSFLTKHPIKDTYGVIETPENFDVMSAQTTSTSDRRERSGGTPVPTASPNPGCVQRLSLSAF